MRTFGMNPLRWKTKFRRRILVLATAATVSALLQACGGNNYATSTANNPAPGVSLVAIQISPATSLIGLAENRQLTATGIYSDGGAVNITSQVTWSASSAPSPTNFVSITPDGMATGTAIGPAVITATVGNVVGVLQLVGETNGFASSTTAILSVPYKTSFIDAAYLPKSQNTIQGAYAVQEINLDADGFTDVLPVELSLMSTIAMPQGFVPNVTAASQASFLVAVISYSSPNVQIIDASNLTTDLTNNTVIASFTAPVSQTTTINGIQCMICAAVVDPATNLLILSTAQGYYTMDLVAGTFTPLPFMPAPASAANFSLNPLAANPYILSASPEAGEVQTLNLATDAVTSLSSGLVAPGSTAIDLVTSYGTVVDAASNNQSLIDLSNPLSPQLTLAPNVGVCSGSPPFMNMAALGVSAAAVVSDAAHFLFTSQTGGNCIGFQQFPGSNSTPLQAANVAYYYGNLPNTPDGNTFMNGMDPNAIATFNDVFNKNQYGLLEDANRQWIAKINLGLALNLPPAPLPAGAPITGSGIVLCGAITPNCPGVSAINILYLPTPDSVVAISQNIINFNNQPTGTSSAQNLITVTNTGSSPLFVSGISIAGTNAADFAELDNCSGVFLLAQSKCSINVIFTPAAPGAASAILSITDNGGASPQSVQLLGTGT
ncbi:MAG TPA: choice-of-anchor D domain-containing protein [Terriglobia bacterium]|nr:choice-of-anchor D domain-containing protein [Terriglobia bacterium]